MENEGEEKSGEKGKENAGTKEEEEGKAAGKRGNGTGKVGATRLKTRTRGTESPRTEIGRTVKNSRKDDKEEEVPGRKARKENIGHVSGAVHKGKIKGKGKGRKKGGGTGARKGGYYWTEDAHKESMEDALEQRNELERKNGWGGKDCKKEKTLEQRAHTRKARKMHKKPHMKTPHIY